MTLQPFRDGPCPVSLLDVVQALDDAGFNDTRKSTWLLEDGQARLGQIWLGYADEVLAEITSCREWYEAHGWKWKDVAP